MRQLDDLNLRQVVLLAMQNMYGSLDERREFLPFFTYRLFDDHISLEHGSFDSPHVVGRYLYAFHWAHKAFGLDIDPKIVHALERRLDASLEIGRKNGTGLAWNEDTGAQEHAAWGHNQREALLSLIALHDLLGSDKALETAAILVRELARHCEGKGVLPGAFLNHDGWQFHEIMGAPPAQSGRIIRALVEYYRVSGDATALGLAQDLAAYNCRHCFGLDGTWTETAGSHIHSITGTIASILDLGFTLRDEKIVIAGKRSFDHGLKPYRSSFGWVQEFRGTTHARGEANNSGDILQCALLLARHLDRTYWADVEKVLRNHLTASQFVSADWFSESTTLKDTTERIYDGIIRRALGGFCFSSPADFKSHEEDNAPINTDLVGGAIHSISEAYHNAWEDDGIELRIHLLVSKNTKIGSVESAIPKQGLLKLDIQDPRTVYVRIPDGVSSGEIAVFANGKSIRPVLRDSYLNLCERPQIIKAEITFPLKGETRTETLNGGDYKVRWVGETVASVEAPRRFFKTLY